MAVSIHATSPGLIGPPVTACGAGRKTAPATLTVATSRKGSADSSRIRSVLRLTVASVIPQPSVCGSMLPVQCHGYTKSLTILQICRYYSHDAA